MRFRMSKLSELQSKLSELQRYAKESPRLHIQNGTYNGKSLAVFVNNSGRVQLCSTVIERNDDIVRLANWLLDLVQDQEQEARHG